MLPAQINDFKTKVFWDDFFQERGPKAFEWYSNFEDLYPAIKHLLAPNDIILQPGCGNSDLSINLCKERIHSINMDFSTLGLVDLKRQHLKVTDQIHSGICTDLICGDILHLPIRNEFFDGVIEKGLLDAMMTTYDERSQAQSSVVFSEYARVLKQGQCAIVVSLAQDHMMRLFADTIDAGLWENLTVIPLYPSSSQSSLLPLCFQFRKHGAVHQELVTLSVSCDSISTNYESWEEFAQRINRLQGDFREKHRVEAAGSQDMSMDTSLCPTHTFFVIDVRPAVDDLDLTQLEDSIKIAVMETLFALKQCTREPLAYGLEKLVITGTVPMECDVALLCDTLEEIEGVSSVDLVDTKPCQLKLNAKSDDI